VVPRACLPAGRPQEKTFRKEFRNHLIDKMPKNKKWFLQTNIYFLLITSIALVAILPALPAKANTVWQVAGSSKDKGFASSGAGYETDVAATDQGTAYIAFQDKKNSKKARVRKFNGNSWVDLANANNPQGLISVRQGYKPAIIASGNQVYAAFSDQANNSRVRIKKWDGNNWSDLSDPSHPSGLISSGKGNEPEFTFDKSNNLIYIAFQDENSGNKIKVMKWDGSEWSDASDENNPSGLVGYGAEVAIAPSRVDNSIYIVYEDVSANLRLRVKKYDGSHWSDITDSAHSNGLISSTPSYSPSISLDSQDRISLVYTYKKEGPTHILYWDGSSWTTLGNGIVASGKTIESQIILDSNDKIFVAMSQRRKGKTGWGIRVQKWNGQTWVDVSDSSHSKGYLSKKGKGDPSLAVGGNNIYISFTDGGKHRRARVMFFNSGSQ